MRSRKCNQLLRLNFGGFGGTSEIFFEKLKASPSKIMKAVIKAKGGHTKF